MRKIYVILGSRNDLTQCIKGLQLLNNWDEKGEIKFMGVLIASFHRNMLSVLGELNTLHLMPPKQRPDVVILGAGKANHLTGSGDAFLRNTLRDNRIRIFGVAFENKKNPEDTEAAISSITQVPGTQVVFNAYVGPDGFYRACFDAVSLDLKNIKLEDPKPVERLSGKEALKIGLGIKNKRKGGK